MEEHGPDDFMWDRTLIQDAMNDRVGDNRFSEIFIGHTTTSRYDPTLKPVIIDNVIALDQGCGWEGKLTLMDIDTKEYWQSDLSYELYPDERGRN